MPTRMSGLRSPAALCLVALLGLSACSDSNEPSNQPAILLMNPRGVPVGQPYQLYVYGENFGQGATINWNGQPLQTNEVITNGHGD